MDLSALLLGVDAELDRDLELLHLTANEGVMSNTARRYSAHRMSDRYFMGGGGDDSGVVDFNPFTFLGYPGTGALVRQAETVCKELLGACFVSFGPLSGIHAMTSAILTTTEPGETVMSVGLDHGGHFSTRGIIERVGRTHVSTSFAFDQLKFDAARIADDFASTGATALYLDVSFYINPHNLMEIRAALGDQATIIYDASHTLGLILAGRFQNPLSEGADVICGNTHKTLPGPQKGLLAYRDERLAVKAQSIINSGLFSSVHTGSMLALAITILEIKYFGAAYADQIIVNSNSLGKALSSLGYEVRKSNLGRYSENHQVHLLLGDRNNYRKLFNQFLNNGISVNFDDAFGGRMLVRLGTQEVTRIGMKEAEMEVVANFLDRSIRGESLQAEVSALRTRFPNVHYSFDE
jgi:glycine/serine hydroxymethyltransferase